MQCNYLYIKRLNRSTRHWDASFRSLSTSSTSLHTRGNCRDTRTRHIACRRATAESAACDEARRWRCASEWWKGSLLSSVRYTQRRGQHAHPAGQSQLQTALAQGSESRLSTSVAGYATRARTPTSSESVPGTGRWTGRAPCAHGSVCAAARLRNHASSPSTIASAYAS